MHVLTQDSFTRIYLDLIKLVSGKGTLEAKTRDLLAVQLVLTDPERSLLLIKKNWKWAFQETFDRMSGIFGEDEERANPGIAYKYRSAWTKKLEKEGGESFDYAYGNVYREAVPKVIRLLRNKLWREAIIPVWQPAYLIYQEDFQRRPCTLTLHFIIRNGQLHAFCNMRTNDIINLLPYDVFHHTVLQRYIAAKLEMKVGRYYHFATHMYYPKKREREGRQFLEKVIEKLGKVSIEQYGFKVSELYSQAIDKDFKAANDILYRGGHVGQAIHSPLLRNMVWFLKDETVNNEFPLLLR